MKTLFQINITANCGSHGRIAENIGKLAISRGWESYIAYGRTAQPSQSHLIKVGNMYDEYLHGIQSRIFDNHGLASKNVTKKLIKTIRDINPDIIHLHNIHGYYLNYPILFDFLASSGKPVVWTLHDCWPLTGHCAHFDSIGCQRWKTECHHCPNLSSYPASFLFDKSQRNYKNKKHYFGLPSNMTIVTVSKWLRDITKESFLQDHPIVVIHNGIDLHAFKPNNQTSNTDGKFHLLGVASSWNKDKGLDEFIELSRNHHYKITLVGIPDNISKKLPQEIECVAHTANIQELADYYSRADVFVNPTYNDSYPTVNLEAQACGTPVITYRAGGSPETISQQTGIVVERGDIGALSEAVEHIRLMSVSEREALSAFCVQRAQRLFDQQLCYTHYLELYENILENLY